MNDTLSIELLEQTHVFPCPYMFKVIGRVEDGFVARVVAAVREELRDLADPPYTFRQSVGGRHVSVTLQPVIQTGRQVLDVYRRIQQLKGLVMYW
jgi:putative lipoic acid-binding regulatory protein